MQCDELVYNTLMDGCVKARQQRLEHDVAPPTVLEFEQHSCCLVSSLLVDMPTIVAV